MKSLLSAAIALAAGALFLAGCGSDPKYNYTFQGHTYTNPNYAPDDSNGAPTPSSQAPVAGNPNQRTFETTLPTMEAAKVVRDQFVKFGFKYIQDGDQNFFFATVWAFPHQPSSTSDSPIATAELKFEGKGHTKVTVEASMDAVQLDYLSDSLHQALDAANPTTAPAQ